ncbi:MAG: hypothetical protein ACAF41_34630 (plasmid) [Leptolyngbya sp. BL-A-14]
MHQTGTTTGVQRRPGSGGKQSRRLRRAATLLALPVSLLSLLPQPVLAAAPPRPLDVQHGTVVVALPPAPRSHHGPGQAAAKRTVMRYEEARRSAQRQRWSAAGTQRTRSAAMTENTVLSHCNAQPGVKSSAS